MARALGGSEGEDWATTIEGGDPHLTVSALFPERSVAYCTLRRWDKLQSNRKEAREAP